MLFYIFVIMCEKYLNVSENVLVRVTSVIIKYPIESSVSGCFAVAFVSVN